MDSFDDAACHITQFDIQPIQPPDPANALLGYYVNSTAPINVEESPILPRTSVWEEIQKIARYLVASDAPQIVIAIHGYGTVRSDAEARYQKIYQYAAQICPPQSSVFFGYHWPSERPTGDPKVPNESFLNKLTNAWNSLPILPAWVFAGGFAIGLITTLSLLLTTSFEGLIVLILIVSIAAFSVLLALILLRISNYFRDNYRATNFGVLDLIELVRQLDQAITEAAQSNGIKTNANKTDANKTNVTKNPSKKIKLSFIGHSMGGFVVTNTIRILSDVFDQHSIQQKPLATIGRVFQLERLVLVAPDIPVETVVPSRANFLRSSLRRCKEAYVFANEGDLAVRLASTAANYFSFPGKTRFSGYRLGNLTAQRFDDKGDRTKRTIGSTDYGIVNWDPNSDNESAVSSPYRCLEIRSSDVEHRLLSEIRDLALIDTENLDRAKNVPISDLFTYFDCTDYVDQQGNPDGSETSGKAKGVVTYARRKSALNLIDYVQLSIAYFFRKPPNNINVHGGYFDGIFSQQLMYKLAFIGFKGLLVSLDCQPPPPKGTFQKLSPVQRQVLLRDLSDRCRERGIQVVLAPVRYEKDILG